MPFGLNCSYKATLELAKPSEMFGAPEIFVHKRATFLRMCVGTLGSENHWSLMIVYCGSVILRFSVTFRCLVRLIAAIFMDCVCFYCQQVSFFFSPLLSPPNMSPLWLHTLSSCFPVGTLWHTHFTHMHLRYPHYCFLTVLICTGTRKKKKKKKMTLKRQSVKNCTRSFSEKFALGFDSSHVGVTHESYLEGTIACLFGRSRKMDWILLCMWHSSAKCYLTEHNTYPQVLCLFTGSVAVVLVSTGNCLHLWKINSRMEYKNSLY